MQVNKAGIEIIRTFRLPDYELTDILPDLEALIEWPINENQFAALASFAHSIGIPRFRRSTLLRHLNEGSPLDAADQFIHWTKKNGKTNQTLLRRRKMERRLFLFPVVVCINPAPAG